MARMRIVICLALASALHAASPTADTTPHPGGSAWADGGETGKRFIVQSRLQEIRSERLRQFTIRHWFRFCAN